MIRKKFASLVLLLVALSFSIIWIEKLLLAEELERQQQQAQAQHATLVSRISLIIAASELQQRQQLSNLLGQLDSVPELAHWRLIDYDNRAVSEKQHSSQPDVPAQHLYFYAGGEPGRLYTLKLYFDPLEPQISAITGNDILLSLVAATLVVIVLYWLFQPLRELEDYAGYLLKSNNDPKKFRLDQIGNPISQVINQLLLKNSLLLKEKLALSEQIRKISYVDDVTGLGNQLFFKAEFQVRLHNREASESGLMMLLSFNDTEIDGEPLLTDEMLREIAEQLREFTKAYPDALLARLRDNDFGVLLPQQSQQQTDRLCKQLINRLDKAVFDQTPLKAHFIDIGLSAYQPGFDYTKVLAEADMAMRNAQLQGANNWYMYGEPLPRHKVRGLMHWRSFLERVLDKRQLQLYGQTIISFNQDNEPTEEVLVRIEDGKTLLTADTFLPMAHSCGLASTFDRQIIDGVIKHSIYQEKEEQAPRYAINLFVASLLDESFSSWLIAKLSSHPELAKRIEFEVSERQLPGKASQLEPVMRQLSALGVGWVIERFGAPDLSHQEIKLLPIERVKIHRSIIFDIYKDKARQLLLQSLLIDLQNQELEVIAEGVEQAADAEHIEEAGLDGAQGYYYGKPRRLKELESYLKAV